MPPKLLWVTGFGVDTAAGGLYFQSAYYDSPGEGTDEVFWACEVARLYLR